MENELTAKQQRFVEEYLVDLNATQAAIRAGYGKKTARNAYRILRKPGIAAALQARRAALSRELEITQERVLRELAVIGFSNVTDFVAVETERTEQTKPGEAAAPPAAVQQCIRVLDTDEMPAGKRAALAGIKQGKNGCVEIKLHDKVRALEMLGKHLGLFDARETAQDTENNLFDAILGHAGEEITADEIPEIEQAAAIGDDMVEPGGIPAP